jgi:hypothetical protein
MLRLHPLSDVLPSFRKFAAAAGYEPLIKSPRTTMALNV